MLLYFNRSGCMILPTSIKIQGFKVQVSALPHLHLLPYYLCVLVSGIYIEAVFLLLHSTLPEYKHTVV